MTIEVGSGWERVDGREVVRVPFPETIVLSTPLPVSLRNVARLGEAIGTEWPEAACRTEDGQLIFTLREPAEETTDHA